MLRMDVKELDRFLDEAFPQARTFGFEIDELDEEHIRLRLPVSKQHLRPGGTVNGPVLMSLADSATYMLVLARLGPVASLIHADLGGHNRKKNDAFARRLSPVVEPCLAPGGLMVSSDRMYFDTLTEQPLPPGAVEGRCFIYRR